MAMVERLAAQLTKFIAQNTNSYISTKLREAKATKELNRAIPIYEELINRLLSDKQEVITIANQYRSELEKNSLPDKDIKYLENTFEKLLILFQKKNNGETPPLDNDTIEQINGLINKDTLKSMQLLGFNFKKALGEPLTRGVSELINKKFNSINTKMNSQQTNSDLRPDLRVYNANIYRKKDENNELKYTLVVPVYSNLTVTSNTPTDLQNKAFQTISYYLYSNGWEVADSDFSNTDVFDPGAFSHTIITIDINFSRRIFNVPEK